MTDLVIHIMPYMVMFNVHWNIRDTDERKAWGFVDTDSIHFNFEFIAEVLIDFHKYYFVWALIYYGIILGV